jgi:hypothetical protein
VELDGFAMTGDRDNVFDGKVFASDGNGHERLRLPPGQVER